MEKINPSNRDIAIKKTLKIDYVKFNNDPIWTTIGWPIDDLMFRKIYNEITINIKY